MNLRGLPPAPRERLELALAIIRAGGSIPEAAQACGVYPTTVSGWRRYPWFAAALDEAKGHARSLRGTPAAASRVVDRVRSGELIKHAVRAEGYTLSALGHWRRSLPGFAAEFAAARADGTARRKSSTGRKKAEVLNSLIGGATLMQACRRAGTSDATVLRWRKADPLFAAECDRLMGPTKRPAGYRKFQKLLPLIRGGATVWNAARVVRLGPSPVRAWRIKFPTLWVQIEAAYADSGRPAPRVRRVKAVAHG